MKIDPDAIAALAPDQSSLKAAAGLMKPAKWSGIGSSHDGQFVWGECAGSGANPYRVMADLGDMGSKCTCPSRKFPCKHAIALMWMRADSAAPFPAADIPEWVTDWLGRRRKTGKPADAADGTMAPRKSLDEARQAEPEAAEDPKAAERRAAAAQKRAAETDRAILDALEALEQWVGDQLRLGLSGFVDDAVGRCRRIAARLVDGKAPVLAGRLDELPSRLLALPTGDRVRAAVVELGKLVLLARAYRARPGDAEVRRCIAAAESRDAVLEDPAAPRVMATWEVLGERIETRRDGLVSQTTWLLNLTSNDPRFAVLVDHYPATAGRRLSSFSAGEQFHAEIAFYPARLPMRALLVSRTPMAEGAARLKWPVDESAEPCSVLAAVQRQATEEPWQVETLVLLPAGRLALDGADRLWWRGGDTVLPLAGDPGALARATDLHRAAAIWSAGRLDLLAAETHWGRIGCDG